MGNENNKATVLIKQCTSIQLRHVEIEESHNGMVGINILGDSPISKKNAMRLLYGDTIQWIGRTVWLVIRKTAL